MAGIRWICLSDLHLGALSSLLTPVAADGSCLDPTRVSPVLEALCDALRTLRAGADPPELVVLGDMFDLALGTSADAAVSFAQFVMALRPGRRDALIAPRIRFVPGNHDHHTWTRSRGWSYFAHVSALAPTEPFPVEAHSTRLDPDEDPYPIRDRLVELLALRADARAEIIVDMSYPNFGLMAPSGERAVLLSHGHFIEPFYRTMSILEDFRQVRPPGPVSTEALEAENGAWIDFFWSSMGDSGDVGRWARKIYESLESEEAVDAEIDAVRRAFTRRPGSGLRARIEGMLLDEGLKMAARQSARRERHQLGTLSESGRSGLGAYLSGPVSRQMREEGWAPRQTSFIFGHTHKPFTEPGASLGLAGDGTVINTGGWVVDAIEPEEHKGASVILIDEDLNIAILHCFGQGAGDGHQVAVEGPLHDAENPLVKEVGDRIRASEAVWDALAEATDATEDQRCAQLQARLDAQTGELQLDPPS